MVQMNYALLSKHIYHICREVPAEVITGPLSRYEFSVFSVSLRKHYSEHPVLFLDLFAFFFFFSVSLCLVFLVVVLSGIYNTHMWLRSLLVSTFYYFECSIETLLPLRSLYCAHSETSLSWGSGGIIIFASIKYL